VWEVEFTNAFGEWWDSLSEREQDLLRERVEQLAERGPTLGRPAVGTMKGSQFDPQMKELRADSGREISLRVLFTFDPRRTAILLLGGNKAEAGWKRWYRAAITEADRLYRAHLDELREEGLIE
jgi:hypothetical protein